jgi:hypothetical protein
MASVVSEHGTKNWHVLYPVDSGNCGEISGSWSIPPVKQQKIVMQDLPTRENDIRGDSGIVYSSSIISSRVRGYVSAIFCCLTGGITGAGEIIREFALSTGYRVGRFSVPCLEIAGTRALPSGRQF